MQFAKNAKYFQTWNKVTKIRRWPVIGPVIYVGIQWLCGKICGHEASKTEWGYGGGEYADTWCRWCNKFMQVPKSVIQFQQPHARTLMEYVDGKRSLKA